MAEGNRDETYGEMSFEQVLEHPATVNIQWQLENEETM